MGWCTTAQTSFINGIKEMSCEDWEQNKESLIAIKLQKDKCLYDESDRYWDAIWGEHYNFTYRERVAEVRHAPQLLFGLYVNTEELYSLGFGV